MEYITTYQTGLKTLLKPSNLINEVSEVILGNQEEIVSLVRERWKRGLRPDGSIIGYYRWKEYAEMKRQSNPLAGGTVDLILTGDLSSGLFLQEIYGQGFALFSADKKMTKIADKYGLDVFGLSDEELEMVYEEALVRVSVNILDKLW